MTVQERNTVKMLNFAGPHIDVRCVEQVRDYAINKRTIVINPRLEPVSLRETPGSSIPAWSSTILKETRIERAASLILLEIKETANLGDIILESGWQLYGDIVGKSSRKDSHDEQPYPLNTPLWRSPQDEVGMVEFDLAAIPGQIGIASKKARFLLKVNLWFAPAQTNCFIHNKHDFIEIHSQIHGQGRMQKFHSQHAATLYEDMLMSPGYTTPLPFCTIQDANHFVYPWHQYYADTDCIWLALEYHPQK